MSDKENLQPLEENEAAERKKKTLSMTERFAAFARRRRAKRAAITARTAVPR